MNVQILPNWFKRIALIVFIISTIIYGADDFIAGWNDGYKKGINGEKPSYEETNHNNYHYTNLVGGKDVIHWFSIISSFSLLLYMLSKEKIEDDYIKLLRLEAYQISFLILVFLSFISFLLGKVFLSELDDSVILFMFLYLIVFYFKKRMV